MKKKKSARRRILPIPTPTPIPIDAPVERPFLVFEAVFCEVVDGDGEFAAAVEVCSVS